MALCKAIKQVDTFIQKNPQWKNRLLESHPEYCFHLLNGANSLDSSKLDENGLRYRINILKGYYQDSQCVIDTYLNQYKFRKKTDDVVDALCLAVAGWLGLENGFTTVPDIPAKDRTGLNMQITASNSVCGDSRYVRSYDLDHDNAINIYDVTLTNGKALLLDTGEFARAPLTIILL